MRPPALADHLLRAALHPDQRVAQEHARLWAAEVDLDTLDFTSTQMLPILTARDKPLPLGDELQAQVTEVARFTWLRTETYVRAVAPAVAALAEAGCDPMLMKGAALVYAHGVPARLRPMFDVDVIVDPERISDAAAILVDAGYAARDQAGLLAGEPRLLSLKHGEEFTLGGNRSIDLHWSALASIRRPEVTRQLAGNAVAANLAGTACRALGPADLLAVTLAHAADPWRDLRERWVGDCTLLVRRHAEALDWELFAARGRQWRIAHQILDAFDYLEDVADVKLPTATRKELKRAPTPFSLRVRRHRGRGADGKLPPTGAFTRALADYESEIGDVVPLGARTGPGDFLRHVARRRGLKSPASLPGDFAFAAAGRPWRVRRRLRGLVGINPLPGERAESWARYEPGQELLFRGERPRTEFLADGWWFPEDFGTWSRGHVSVVRLGLGAPIEGEAQLAFGLRVPISEGHPRASVDVVVNEHRLTTLVFDASQDAIGTTQTIPASALAGADGVEIKFVVDRTVVPNEIGTAPDQREIGCGLGELTLTRG
jgi:hypothetical protein